MPTKSRKSAPSLPVWILCGRLICMIFFPILLICIIFLTLDRCLRDIWQITRRSCSRQRGHLNQRWIEYLAKEVNSFRMASIFAMTLKNLSLPWDQQEVAAFPCKARIQCLLDWNVLLCFCLRCCYQSFKNKSYALANPRVLQSIPSRPIKEKSHSKKRERNK